MRLRNIRGSKEVIESCGYVVQNPSGQKNRWPELFGNDHPIRIEVGMGKGRFLMDMARLNPEMNYVGIEMYDSVLLRAVQKRSRLEQELSNLYFIRMDARELPEVFGEGEVDRIYLNFSDPWPKERHAKRRLTSGEFLQRYEKILKAGGFLEFKTDNQDLFSFSLEEMKAAKGWSLAAFTFDLHGDAAMREGNVMTEYEEKFSSMGNPICKMTAQYKGKE